MTGRSDVKQNRKRTFLWVLGPALILSLAVALGASPALAQGKPAPGPNQAFLYEMSEEAVLLNSAGHVLVPDPTGISPTGLVDSTDGSVGIPARRVATSQLQGVAALGSFLCSNPALITIPKAKECTVVATGHDDVPLVPDPATGQLVPTTGAVNGTYAVVVQLDNNTDSPELPVQTGTFSGMITFQAPLPLGFIHNGTFTIDGVPGTFALNATFRMPFAMSTTGEHKKAGRGEDAFYLLDNGKLQPVRQDERAVGWPTVRFEATVTP